jgi:hypothetical protein
MSENLNIEENRLLLIKKALKRNQSPAGASLLLKVSDRTIHRYINKYKIKWRVEDEIQQRL